ncbi:MAG: SET domain-containing protein [Bdellovibrionales bacterium]|nr:SET domain-containing protein [Bdellovibrionales bacterium]
MMHPAIELRFVSDHIGYGLFAKQAISRGTITWAQDGLDRTFTKQELSHLSKFEMNLIDRYAYLNYDHKQILCWDMAKYINHSCKPNVLSTGFHFDIAITDIAKDEELVTDYAMLNLEAPFECDCGQASCRKTIVSQDIAPLIKTWDHNIRKIFPLIGDVKQPLWELVPNKDLVKKAIADSAQLPSAAQNLIPEYR